MISALRKPSSFIAILLAALCGCKGSSGPPRFELRGQVTYRGQPVPGGRILFEPDTDAGNRGTSCVAEIVEGQYQSREDKGCVGGPHTVTIFGTNGKTATETYDNSLFTPYRTKVDFPHEDTTHDFQIPKEHK